MNQSEQAAAARLRAEGWNVLRNGWPDFLCYRWVNGKQEIMCVEVKDEKTSDRVSKAQAAVHAVLNSAGLPVRVAGDPRVSRRAQRQARARAQAQDPEWRRRLAVGIARRDSNKNVPHCVPHTKPKQAQ